MTRKPRRAELDVTLDEYEALLEAQGGVCALCANPPKTRRLDVDHNHRTGDIRGLLCQRCNRATPSERYLPVGWDLERWARGVLFYVQPQNALADTLDEINRRRKDATDDRV